MRETGNQKIKLKNINPSIDYNILMSGYYAFGANQFDIINAQSKIIDYLEIHNSLIVEKMSNKAASAYNFKNLRMV